MTTNRSAIISKVYKVLKKHYKPIAPPSDRPALEHLIYGCLLENSRYDAADEAFAKLKELLKSESFPDTVVAYHRGALDDATLKLFRDGLIKADKTATGRLLLMLWMLTAFEPVPPDFDQMLTDIAKAYPAPAGEPANRGQKERANKRRRPKPPDTTHHPS